MASENELMCSVSLFCLCTHARTKSAWCLASVSLPDAIRMASLTPAERVGIADEVGSLEPGKRADVLVLGSDLDVDRVFLGGEELG